MNPEQKETSDINEIIDIENYLIPELTKLDSSSRKVNSIALLVVTVILFFSAQIVSTNPYEILILILVLFFHETGHLLAMKTLRYHDVKMFFIPFLGAAVTGKSRNDSALKSCLVSLMGPFPGIIFGAILYVVFGLTKNYYVLKTAEIMLLLNAMNFLPIMPLDGGRFIDVLFIGNRYFRFLFALLGVAFFVFLGISSSDIIIAAFGALALWSAITNFRLNSITKGLKKIGFRPTSLKDLLGNINDLTTITTKLYQKMPKAFEPKINMAAIYRYIDELISMLKFKRAKIITKMFLLGLYAVLLMVSIAVSFYFIAMNYSEKIKTEIVNGKTMTVTQRYFFGKKNSEIPIDSNQCLNGEGKGFFHTDTNRIEDIFYYKNGYRTGIWVTFDATGDTIKKSCYENGRFVSESALINKKWVAKGLKQLSFYERLSATISYYAQPFKSLHSHFNDKKN